MMSGAAISIPSPMSVRPSNRDNPENAGDEWKTDWSLSSLNARPINRGTCLGDILLMSEGQIFANIVEDPTTFFNCV